MKTKQEYIDALNRMVEVYDNLDGCMSAINIFNEGVHLLEGLVNEHFEEKQETNLDHYKDDIAELFIDNLAIVDGKPNRCICTVCDERCDIRANCDDETHYELVKAWLRNPYKKPTYKLTKFEKELLQCYSSAYRFKLFNSLNGMKEKGYFKSVDENEKIEDILANCEVVKNAES